MPLQLTIASIHAKGRPGPYETALAKYRDRIRTYATLEIPVYDTEAALFATLTRQKSRTPPLLILLDSRGKSLSSQDFAAFLGRERDAGRQSILFAIGPAGGWSAHARASADLLLSLGPMTLPHQLARVVLAEQVYRAFTILAGHPYHTGH